MRETRRKRSLTLELGPDTSINQLQSLKNLAQRLVVVLHNLGAPAIGEIVEGVGLLPVVVRAHGVHPDNHILLWEILVAQKRKLGSVSHVGAKGLSHGRIDRERDDEKMNLTSAGNATYSFFLFLFLVEKDLLDFLLDPIQILEERKGLP